MGARLQFFIGKGGVGKSTTSALTAIHLADTGRDTLLVSMDPAHNQRDIFQQPFSEKPRRVIPNLAVKEVDVDYWTAAYLADCQVQLKKAYSYQSAFNLQSFYNILKYSPGLEEYALLLAFENTVHSEKNRDDIVFDMPPTALTLRFFSLPSIALIWIRELLKLRNRIYEKKEIISKIRFGGKVIEQDKVKVKLESMGDEHQHLREHFTHERTEINLVLNNDPISLAEAVRTRGKLEDIGIRIKRVVLNKTESNASMKGIENRFGGCPIRCFPQSRQALYGVDSLKAYLLHLADGTGFSPPMPN